MSCLYLQVAVTKLWTVLKNKRKKKEKNVLMQPLFNFKQDL